MTNKNFLLTADELGVCYEGDTAMNKGITGSTGCSRSYLKTTKNETSWGHSTETNTGQFSSW
jgi:hypothetical protein